MQHHRIFIQQLAIAVAAATVLALGACSSDSNGVSPAGASSQIAFVATNDVTTGATAAVAPVTVGAHTLDITSATLTISRAELKRTAADSCAGDDDNDDLNDDHDRSRGDGRCGELRVGNTTVNLPLDGNVVTIPANTIPAGTFSEIELRVSQVELKGTFDGNAFDITVPVNAKSEVELATPLVVTADSATTITVSVPVTEWLMNADGTLVDPTAVLANAALRAQIANRIRASFRAFEDRDHDGHDDHGGDRDGGH